MYFSPKTFAKHTTKKHEKHPDAKLEFAPKVTEAYLIDAIKNVFVSAWISYPSYASHLVSIYHS